MEDGTGFSHFTFRDYSAPLRRWLAPDPAWLSHPEISPYVYVGNNPIMRRDWLGLDFVPGGALKGGDLYQEEWELIVYAEGGYDTEDYEWEDDLQEKVYGEYAGQYAFEQWLRQQASGNNGGTTGSNGSNSGSGGGGGRGTYIQRAMYGPGPAISDAQMAMIEKWVPGIITHLEFAVMGGAVWAVRGGIGVGKLGFKAYQTAVSISSGYMARVAPILTSSYYRFQPAFDLGLGIGSALIPPFMPRWDSPLPYDDLGYSGTMLLNTYQQTHPFDQSRFWNNVRELHLYGDF